MEPISNVGFWGGEFQEATTAIIYLGLADKQLVHGVLIPNPGYSSLLIVKAILDLRFGIE